MKVKELWNTEKHHKIQLVLVQENRHSYIGASTVNVGEWDQAITWVNYKVNYLQTINFSTLGIHVLELVYLVSL